MGCPSAVLQLIWKKEAVENDAIVVSTSAWYYSVLSAAVDRAGMAIKFVRRAKNVLVCGAVLAVVGSLAPLLCALRAVAAPPLPPSDACLVFATGCASWRVLPTLQLEIGRLLRLIGLPERVTRFRSAAVYPKTLWRQKPED